MIVNRVYFIDILYFYIKMKSEKEIIFMNTDLKLEKLMERENK